MTLVGPGKPSDSNSPRKSAKGGKAKTGPGGLINQYKQNWVYKIINRIIKFIFYKNEKQKFQW